MKDGVSVYAELRSGEEDSRVTKPAWSPVRHARRRMEASWRPVSCSIGRVYGNETAHMAD